MSQNLQLKLKKIESFSKHYEALMTCENIAFTKAESWDRVRRDWWYALLFFFDRAFYKGRNDTLSQKFERATIKALETVLVGSSSEKLSELQGLTYWLIHEQWERPENPLWEALSQEYEIGNKKTGVGRGKDKKFVLASMDFIVKHCEGYNIIEYAIGHIQQRNTRLVYDEILNIYDVGPKVAALFLRDVVFIYKLEGFLKERDYDCLMPIDTWIKQIGKRLEISVTAENMVDLCQDNKVSPILFNQGAWYLGKHSFDILLDNIHAIIA
ncbi:hypothetical protein ACFLVE_03815 [Chloroflexota bacterium]